MSFVWNEETWWEKNETKENSIWNKKQFKLNINEKKIECKWEIKRQIYKILKVSDTPVAEIRKQIIPIVCIVYVFVISGFNGI